MAIIAKPSEVSNPKNLLIEEEKRRERIGGGEANRC